MDNSEINKNFYTNICEPLLNEDKLLFEAIKLFYDPTKYNNIKKNFRINSNNIKPLIFGYRYCLNELLSKNTRGIYYPLYDSKNINCLKEQFYPGNDTEYNKLYSKIINHFKLSPNEGCYVCQCEKGYYLSVKAGFPSNLKCPKCSQPIGSTLEGIYFFREEKIAKRDDCFRIFRDEKEIEELKKDKVKRDKLKEINYMTLEEYKQKYIYKTFEKEKGIFINKTSNAKDCVNDFKNDQKIIRNLSQISFRILNYILYSHLFFARLITNKKNDFNIYLPKGMLWAETLLQCWNLLKKELLNENINSIEKFMSLYLLNYFHY